MKSRVSALLGAFVLAAWVALPALAAAPPGKVTIEATGCTFSVRIDLEQAYALIGWKVKEYNAANWNDGATLFKGSGPTDSDGNVTFGPFTAAEGHYTVAVDDEYPPDGSSIVTDFILSCPTSSGPVGSEAPVTSSGAPSTAPSGNELPVEGSAPPTGQEEGIVGTPPALTPPPTDTAAAGALGSDGGWQVVLVTLAGLSLMVGLILPKRITATGRAVARLRNR